LAEFAKYFSAKLGGATGISQYKAKVENRLSDLKEFVLDKNAAERMLSRGKDPLVYEVYEMPQEEPSEGTFNIGCTILYPGKIGNEYNFTKGHFHLKEPRSEIYIGMEGEGVILMQDREGNTAYVEIKPNVLVYIPPRTAHRSINTGKAKLVFLAIYFSDGGHDYDVIKTKGFKKLFVEKDGKSTVIDNPRYK
jgi:glucose-6-phosphate isomerase